jgi:hypothetical protein
MATFSEFTQLLLRNPCIDETVCAVGNVSMHLYKALAAPTYESGHNKLFFVETPNGMFVLA